MEINNSNKVYSIIVAGILVSSIITIFVAFALGVDGNNNFSDNSNRSVRPMSTEPLYLLETNKSEKILDKVIKAKTGHDDVSVDQTVYNLDHHYVEPGEIQFVDDNFDEDFPVCVTPDWGDDKWVVVRVRGGYVPEKQSYYGYPGEYYGLFIITDECGNIIYNPCNTPRMYVGWFLDEIVDEWTCSGTMCEECWVYYNFTITGHICDNWICLDSSYDPDSGHFQSDKYVLVEYDIHWKGCEFDYILAHENRVPGIPNSRI
jgi:hypothetical protein